MAAHESQRTHAHETIRCWVAERDGRQETSGGERSHFNTLWSVDVSTDPCAGRPAAGRPGANR